jgi:predicted RNA-binding protein
MPSYWTLSGRPESWRVALEEGVWGASGNAKGLWARVQPGDIVVFYATGEGVIGYGVVEGKFEGDEPLWPEEREVGKVIWPYRLKFRVVEIFDRPRPRPKNMLVALAINKLEEETFRELLGRLPAWLD